MGHSREQKAKTHARIVALAAKRFREKGLAGIGIAELMKEAGLTVGGFYKHFGSRDDLVAEAIRSTTGRWPHNADADASRRTAMTYNSTVDGYLSEAHRDHPGTGCPLAALAGEIARSDKRTRALVSGYVRENIESLAKALRPSSRKDEGTAKSWAILTYCALVGAITIARAVSDENLSREILTNVAERLKDPAPKAAPTAHRQ